MQLYNEGRLLLQCQNPFLNHYALDVVLLDYDVLFQHLHGIHLIGVSVLG